jgi:hypothetical protein
MVRGPENGFCDPTDRVKSFTRLLGRGESGGTDGISGWRARVEQVERSETIDLDTERFVSLEFSRQWPKYVVSWWVRQRVGESDFPLATGSVDRLPPGQGEDPESVWNELRQSALDQAMTAAPQATAPEPKRRSFLDRLLGRG